MKNNQIENRIKDNRGQIAVIVLLVSAVILTLGLSASKSTTTNNKISTDEEALKTAFNTAESAINNYLDDNSKTNYSIEGSDATIVSSSIGGDVQSLSSEGEVLENTNQLFWLVKHNIDGSIGTSAADYYQSDSLNLSVDDDFTGALKIDYLYLNSGTYNIIRHGYNFSAANPLVNGYTTNNTPSISLTLTGTPLLISVTPLGGSTKVTVFGTSSFPVQGEEITANSSTNNNIKTQIKTRYIYQIPSFMFDAITAKNIVE